MRHKIKRRHGIKKIWFAYGIYTAVLLIVCISIVIYVYSLLKSYEASQPENVIKSVVSNISEAAENGKLKDVLSFEGDMAFLAQDMDSFKQYSEALKNSNLSYQMKSTSEKEMIYSVKNGERTVANITLESHGDKTKLIIFSYTDWRVKSVLPALSTSALEVPSNFSVSVNGKDISCSEQKASSDGYVVYDVPSLAASAVKINDGYGNSVDYKEGTVISQTESIVKIPSNYSLKVNGFSVELSPEREEEMPIYKYVKDYAQMPKLCTYKIYTLTETPDIKAYDSYGNEAAFSNINGEKAIMSQQGSELPGDISVNVIEIAEMWSKFMSADLGGQNYGFYKLSDYLIQDSYLYNKAWEYATGVDITFTSVHTLGNPPFINEAAGNYYRYSDICFSVEVKFGKQMHLNSGAYVLDEVNSTFFFVYVDDSDDGIDNPTWHIADIQEII